MLTTPERYQYFNDVFGIYRNEYPKTDLVFLIDWLKVNSFDCINIKIIQLWQNKLELLN